MKRGKELNLEFRNVGDFGRENNNLNLPSDNPSSSPQIPDRYVNKKAEQQIRGLQ